MTTGHATYQIDVDARGAQATLDGVVKDALPKFNKLSGAINASSAALGGLGGKAASALGVISKFGDVFLVGGPLGIGIAAITTAIGVLVSRQREAAEASEKLAHQLRDIEAKAADDVADSYARLNRELASLAGRSAEYRVEEARAAKRAADLEVRIAKERASYRGALALSAQSSLLGDLFGESVRDIVGDDKKRANEEWEKSLAGVTEALAKQTIATNELRAAEAALFVAREKGTATSTSKGARTIGPVVTATIVSAEAIDPETGMTAKERMAFDAEQRRIRRQRAAEVAQAVAEGNKRWADDEAEYRRNVEFELAEYRKKQNQEVIDKAIESLREYADVAESVVLRASGLVFDAIEQMAAGQKVQFDAMLAGFVRSVGEQLLAIGVRQMFEGAGMLALSIGTNNPAQVASGLQLIAVGSAAAAAGGSMAASGAVWQGSIAGRGASSGGGGGSGRSGAARPSRSDDDRRPGRDQNVTIVYNGGTFLGDPSESARRFERARRRAARDTFVPAEA